MAKQTPASKYDRSKFRDHVKSDELKADDRKVEEKVGIKQKNRSEFLELQSGNNKFLIFPSHDIIRQMMGEDIEKPSKFYHPRQVWWLPVEVDELDEKTKKPKIDKKTGKPVKTMSRRTFMDARIHATENEQDVVNLYIETVKEQLAEQLGASAQDEIKKKMIPIYGAWNNDPKKRVNGITGKPTWIMYVEQLVGDNRVFGRLEIGKAVKMGINEIIAKEEEGEAIGSESNNPLTDIELRRALVIKYNPDSDTPTGYYTTSIDSDIDKNPDSDTYKQIKTYPLSDEELDKFLEHPSLVELYSGVYNKKHFDDALAGLRLFDDEQEFGVFDNQHFLNEAESLRKLYPDPKEEEQTDYSGTDDADDGVDEFENMDRKEMKDYSRENQTGIIVTQKLTDDDLRAALRKWKADNDEPTGEVEEEEPTGELEEENDGRSEATADVDAVMDTRPSAKGVKTSDKSVAERTAEMRKNLGMKKGSEIPAKGKGK